MSSIAGPDCDYVWTGGYRETIHNTWQWYSRNNTQTQQTDSQDNIQATDEVAGTLEAGTWEAGTKEAALDPNLMMEDSAATFTSWALDQPSEIMDYMSVIALSRKDDYNWVNIPFDPALEWYRYEGKRFCYVCQFIVD